MSENTLNVPSDLTSVVTVIDSTPVKSENSKESSVVSKLHIERYLSFIDDPDTKQIVIILTNNSESVQDIINTVNLILADGKVDMSDAPLLLGFIRKITAIRTKDLNLSKSLTLDHFLDIIKLVFTILGKEGVLKIDNIDEFLVDINKIIKIIKDSDAAIKSMGCGLSCFSKKN